MYCTLNFKIFSLFFSWSILKHIHDLGLCKVTRGVWQRLHYFSGVIFLDHKSPYSKQTSKQTWKLDVKRWSWQLFFSSFYLFINLFFHQLDGNLYKSSSNVLLRKKVLISVVAYVPSCVSWKCHAYYSDTEFISWLEIAFTFAAINSQAVVCQDSSTQVVYGSAYTL